MQTAPLAIAHRGGAGLAPENTLLAFERSTALGVRYLESDVHVTSDGHVVCFHDATVDRVTAGTGRVASLTLAELRSLRVLGAEPVPTLVEALEHFPDSCFTVDLKQAAAIEPLAKVLRRTGVAERVCVAGAWDGWLEAVRAQVPGVATTLGWRSLTALLVAARLGVRPPRQIATARFAHVPVSLGRLPVFVSRLVELAATIDVRVVVWTVDDTALMRQLLDDGVDGVITDRPDLLRELLIARGQWVPGASLDAQSRASRTCASSAGAEYIGQCPVASSTSCQCGEASRAVTSSVGSDPSSRHFT